MLPFLRFSSRRRLPLKRLLSFGQTERIAGIRLELLHSKGRVLRSQRDQLVERLFACLSPWLLQLSLTLKQTLLNICGSLRSAFRRFCGSS